MDRLAWVVYLMICGVGMGYWLVPSQPEHPADLGAAAVERADAVGPASPRVTLAAAVSRAVPVQTNLRVPMVVSTSAPELHARVRPLLNRGTNLSVASADFADATQFAAVAHAARNTNVPFMVLKYRVVTQGMTLKEALRVSKRDLNADAEAELALAQARSDLTALAR